MGLAVDAASDEYYTGLMERVVDGPQRASWAPAIKEAMDLRGQKVEMIVKPTTSVYAPFYLSSRGYAVLVKSNWPGYFDFCASNPERVKIEFEGPSLEIKVYTASDPATLVRAHALDPGPPFLPPRWMFSPWRWRDEHTQRDRYYDGTPVTGPFNSEVMEDVLMMQAFGIPCGVYWASRTGLPIIRPLWLIDPQSRDAWTNWWTYLYGPDLLVSPIWEKGKREQEVYFPTGSRWRDAWHRDKVYEGGKTVTIRAELYQIPLFIREGSSITTGDLHREYRESLAIAQKKPDLSKLDAALKEWFERNKQ